MEAVLKRLIEMLGPQAIGVILPAVMRVIFEYIKSYLDTVEAKLFADKVLDFFEDAGESYGLPKWLDAVFDEVAAVAREVFEIPDND